MGDRFAAIDMGRGLWMPECIRACIRATSNDGKLYVVNYGTKATTSAQQA